MTTSDVLKVRICATPFDDHLRELLRDALAEERDSDPAQVDAEVNEFVTALRDAREIALAAAELRRGAPCRERLHGLASQLALAEPVEPLTVMVGPGYCAHVRRCNPPVHGHAFYWGPLTVILGARLVLDYVKRLRAGEDHRDVNADLLTSALLLPGG